MKKYLLLVAAIALYQHWDQLQRWVNPPAPGQAHDEVVLYATSWCGYCTKTRELFAQDGVRYREVNIETNAAGHQQYQALGGSGVPLIDVRGRLIHGYDAAAIRAALKP